MTNATPKHAGYWLSPQRIYGRRWGWLRASVAASRSVAVHFFYQTPERSTVQDSQRLGITAMFFGYCVAFYVEGRASNHRIVGENESSLALAVDGGPIESAPAAEPGKSK